MKHDQAHPHEEVIERYSMGRLGEQESNQLEEHLLLCAVCQDRLDEADEYIGLMRESLRNQTEAAAEPFWKRWLEWNWMPLPALASVAAALVAVLLWHPWRAPEPAEWRTVELETMRGGTETAPAMAGFALELRLRTAGLADGEGAAQIVDADGAVLVAMPVTVADGKAELRYSAGLVAGRYWVRLQRNGETVREYALRVEKR